MSSLIHLRENKPGRFVLSIFGCRISVTKLVLRLRSCRMRREQDKAADIDAWALAENLVVFLLPKRAFISGGVMSIYSLCRTSRELLPGAQCVLATEPGRMTYCHNDTFRNSEFVYRWEQVVEAIRRRKGRTIIHVPEYMAAGFAASLTSSQRNMLKAAQVELNILNQNMDLMPPPASLTPLFKLTARLTQTLAFKRNCTQETADAYGMPTHLFSVHIDLSGYSAEPCAEKQKLIAYSPDAAPEKEATLESLRRALPDYELRQIKDLTFDEYMELIARAFFVISFGEGFDGYYQQPYTVGTVGLAVYNGVFFPSAAWRDMPGVYASYADMAQGVPQLARAFEADPDAYYSHIKRVQTARSKVYQKDEYRENLRAFYSGSYHLLPSRYGSAGSCSTQPSSCK